MSVNRRELLASTGAAAAAAGIAALRPAEAVAAAPPGAAGEWAEVRRQFRLDPQYVHLAGLLLSSHPDPVREAVERHRRELDRNPVHYVQGNNRRLEGEVRAAAARYVGGRPQDIALTNSTTMGLALVYNGLRVREGQELLTSRWDYYSTRESLRYKAARSGADYVEIEPYADIRRVTADELVERLTAAVTPRTRVVAVTWVHSATGLKVPVRRVAERLAEINRDREPAERALLCVDGVHGFGVENATMADLGCDFFMAGTHKWIFAPRGTGLIWGKPEAQEHVTPTVPTFSGRDGWGPEMTPGGYNSFEHRWAAAQAFDYHGKIGKARVQERIRSLARQAKEGLAGMKHVRLYTPRDPALSAGIVCFDVEGKSPREVVLRLRERKIIASTTPYTPSYARLTPCIFNTADEVDQALRAIRALA
jgi:isopenicillin-N epimerase